MGGCRPTAIGWATIILLLFAAGGVLAYQRLAGGGATLPPPLIPSVTVPGFGPAPVTTPAPAVAAGAATPASSPGALAAATMATATAGSGRPAPGSPTAAPAASPTAVAAQPTASPLPTAAGITATALYDAFASYLPLPYMAQQGLAPGVTVRAQGIGLEAENLEEAERFARLKRGEIAFLPATHASCALFCDDDMLVPLIIDESAGADEVWVRESIQTFNDLAGKRIAFADRSVSHAMLLEILQFLQLRDKVTLQPAKTVDEAIDAFKAGRADAVVAWQPNTTQKLTGADGAPLPGARKLTDTSRFRLVLDVLIFNRRWAEANPAAAQGVVDGWFAALKAMQDNPDAFAATLAKSVDPNWSGVANGDDLRAQLAVLAQATLQQNRLALEDPALLAGRIAEVRRLWAAEGLRPPAGDPARLVDSRFVLKAADNAALAASQPPVNPTFTLASRIRLPRLTEAELGRTQTVARLPIEKINFNPDSFVIRADSRAQLDGVADLLRRTPGLYLVIEGRAAKPLAEPPQETIDLARDRANAVRSYLASQPGIEADRLIVTWPKTDAELRQRLRYYDSANEAELEQDRIVIFTLREPSGR